MRERKIPKRKRIRVDGVFDIECQGWNKFVLGVTMTKNGESVVHYRPEDMVDEMLNYGGVWWSHNGGKYDTLQVLEVLRGWGIGQSVSLAQSRVTRTMGAGLTIRDSYALVPMGLESMAQMGRVQVPRLWFDCSCSEDCGGYCAIRRNMSYYLRLRLEEYCVEDCRALLAGLTALQEFADDRDYDLLGTIGGSSWATARRTLGLQTADFSPSQWRRLREGYYGGRCSVFRPVVHESVGHWDIGSAYPSALANAELPTGELTEHGSRSARKALADARPGIYSVTVLVPEMHIPPLAWGWGLGISFPHGVVSGAWTLADIHHAESYGCKITAVEWAMTWSDSQCVFKEWISRIYELRSRMGKDTVWGKWLRDFPNSLCGKMAERPDKRFLRLNPPTGDIVRCPVTRPCTLTACSGVCGSWEQVDQWGQMWSVPFYRQSESGHIHWAAYITASARAQHHSQLVDHGKDVVYCDTDSLWGTGLVPPSPCGSGLGEWSLKCRASEWEGPAPKAYAYTDEKTGERIIRSSGAMLSPAEWTKGSAVQDRGVMSVVQAARHGHGLFARANRKWTLPRHGEWYGDRRITTDGTTRPVTTKELRIRLNERNEQRRQQRDKEA